MEDAPVTVATGALGPVIAKLSALLQRRRGDREYQLRRHTRKDVKLIKSKLKSVHSILWEIWEKEHLDAAGKELRMEAWRLADDMNDAVDDFILSMKRSNDRKRFIQAKIQPSPFQDLKRRADDVYERCRNKWKSTAHTTISSLLSRTRTTVVDSGPAERPARAVDPYVHKHISELWGMEEPRDKLIEHLVGEEESTPQLKMASILGGAGMGKTTLARLVYEAIEDKFQARAFVSITSGRNMTEVLASILQQVTADSTDLLLAATRAAATKNKHLVDVISRFLRNKRYLVIIDDIWHSSEWETVKESLPENNLGSRIVTTSRVKAITEKWRDNFEALIYEIDYLDDIEGLSNKMIDMNADVVGEGVYRDHSIVEMCHDMPLALTCMFSALAKEREHQGQQRLRLWTCDLHDRIEEQVTKNGIQNTPGFEPLVESLELGYNHLPHHMMKTCLLYCSIYPEGHLFDRDDLVRRWMAQGFVCKQEVAKGYFDELASRGWFYSDDSGSRFYPMMQSYLRCKLREDNFITFSFDIPCSQVGRLCIEYWPSSSDTVDTLSGINDWHHIRSLVIFKDAERVPYKHLENLRVLDVQCSSDLEDQHLKDMCGLLRLRHLFMSVVGKGITEIPAEIARLQYLETLGITKILRILRLPAEIGDLKQLKTLVLNKDLTRWSVSTNSKLAKLAKPAELPREMGNLQDILETLCIRGSYFGEQAWEIIGKLKKLKTLDVNSNYDLSGIPRDIGELQHLETLNVSDTRITEVPKEIGKLQHLETLDVSNTRITEVPKEIGKLQHLKTLNLQSTLVTQLPREIGNLQRLQILDLGDSMKFTKLPQDIGKLQDLETLNLNHTNVKKIPREIGGLKNLKNLDGPFGRLPFEAAQLSKLERLPKCARRAWNNSDLVPLLAGGILSFSETHYHGSGDGGLIVGTKHVHIPPWIKEHFNNIGSLDMRICKLEEQDLNILREMPYLCELTLRFEAVPRKPVAISGGGFAKLFELTVDSRVPRITFQEGAMPSLNWIRFEFQFYGGPPDTDHPIGIKHLVSLKYVTFVRNDWYRTDSPCISATIDVVREEAREHPNRIEIYASGKSYQIFPGNRIAQSSEDGSDACSSSAAREMDEESSQVSNEAYSSGADGIEEVEA